MDLTNAPMQDQGGIKAPDPVGASHSPIGRSLRRRIVVGHYWTRRRNVARNGGVPKGTLDRLAAREPRYPVGGRSIKLGLFHYWKFCFSQASSYSARREETALCALLVWHVICRHNRRPPGDVSRAHRPRVRLSGASAMLPTTQVLTVDAGLVSLN